MAKLRTKADAKAAVDYGLHMNITHLTPEVEAQIPRLPDAGITSLKVFTAYNNRLRLADSDILRVMRIARKHGLLTMLHAENGDVIDLLVQEALQNGHTTPIWHARTRPAWGAVEAALRGLKIFPLLDGFRGRPAARLDPVIDAVMAIAAYAARHLDTLAELDVNPLMVGENGAIAVDALILDVPGA